MQSANFKDSQAQSTEEERQRNMLFRHISACSSGASINLANFSTYFHQRHTDVLLEWTLGYCPPPGEYPEGTDILSEMSIYSRSLNVEELENRAVNYRLALNKWNDNLRETLLALGYSINASTRYRRLGTAFSGDPKTNLCQIVTSAVLYDSQDRVSCLFTNSNSFVDILVAGVRSEVEFLKEKLNLINVPNYVPEHVEDFVDVNVLSDFTTNPVVTKFITTRLVRSKCKLPRESFYPFLTENISIDDYIHSFMESPSPVLILMGPPGTGKSTFIRNVAFHVKNKAMLCSKTEIMLRTGFVDEIMNQKCKLVILEDADDVISTRKSGNVFMAGLLNATDGVVGSGDKKIIITTNLANEEDIDHALMREGRCFDVVKFRNLTIEEATVVQNECIAPELHKNLNERKSWSLSQVLNQSHSGENKRRRRANIGFTKN